MSTFEFQHFCFFRTEVERLQYCLFVAHQQLEIKKREYLDLKKRADFNETSLTLMETRRKLVNFRRRQRKRKKRLLQENEKRLVQLPSSPVIDHSAVLLQTFSQIHGLEDIIKLQDHPKVKSLCTNRKFQTLLNLIPVVTELNSLVGIPQVKQSIFQKIMFNVQFAIKKVEHVQILGPPGVGKTRLSMILAKLMFALGIVKTDTVVCASRNTMIGKYLGHTAQMTAKVIESARGGVLLIDEVYSFGSPNNNDSFSKEMIDTLNPELSDVTKEPFVCIIAGYKKQVNECFLDQNPGLRRRFTFTIHIETYNHKEMFLIFQKLCETNQFHLDPHSIPDIQQLFQKNEARLLYFAGDIQTLFQKTIMFCGLRYVKITTEVCQKALISVKDVEQGFQVLLQGREPQENHDLFLSSMYT